MGGIAFNSNVMGEQLGQTWIQPQPTNKGKAILGPESNFYYKGPKKNKKKGPKLTSQWKKVNVFIDPCLNKPVSPPRHAHDFDPVSEEIIAQGHKAQPAKEGPSREFSDADDEAEPSTHIHIPSLISLGPQTSSIARESESYFSSQSMNDFLPLPWHGRDDLKVRVVGIPTVYETSRWTKIALGKACKAFGVNAMGFEHEILGIILRMEQKKQLQLQQQKLASPA